MHPARVDGSGFRVWVRLDKEPMHPARVDGSGFRVEDFKDWACGLLQGRVKGEQVVEIPRRFIVDQGNGFGLNIGAVLLVVLHHLGGVTSVVAFNGVPGHRSTGQVESYESWNASSRPRREIRCIAVSPHVTLIPREEYS
jgi:hypothetical protein